MNHLDINRFFSPKNHYSFKNSGTFPTIQSSQNTPGSLCNYKNTTFLSNEIKDKNSWHPRTFNQNRLQRNNVKNWENYLKKNYNPVMVKKNLSGSQYKNPKKPHGMLRRSNPLGKNKGKSNSTSNYNFQNPTNSNKVIHFKGRRNTSFSNVLNVKGSYLAEKALRKRAYEQSNSREHQHLRVDDKIQRIDMDEKDSILKRRSKIEDLGLRIEKIKSLGQNN